MRQVVKSHAVPHAAVLERLLAVPHTFRPLASILDRWDRRLARRLSLGSTCLLFRPLDVLENLSRFYVLFQGLDFRIGFHAELVRDLCDDPTELGNLVLGQKVDLQVKIRAD
jgi:hypothetical protein